MFYSWHGCALLEIWVSAYLRFIENVIIFAFKINSQNQQIDVQ